MDERTGSGAAGRRHRWLNSYLCFVGGVEKRLGTNPIAVALPAEKHLPILLDMATSRVSRGKLLVNMKKGEPVPDDWALAIDGSRTTDAPQAFRGILLPLLTRRTGPLAGMALTALGFAALHADLGTFVALAIFSVALSMAYIRTGTIWVPIEMHALFNAANLALLLALAHAGVV